MAQVDKLVHKLRAELNRLSERVETQARYTDVLERRLRETMKRFGSESVSVEIADPIQPRNDGINLRASDAARPALRFDSRRPGPEHAPSTTADHWWPRGDGAARPLVPNAGWQNYGLHGWVDKVIGVSVCNLPRQVVAGIVDSIAAQQARSRDFVPVFLTDSTDFDLFRRHGFVFEYLPDGNRRSCCSGTQDWSDYAAQRRALLEQKWGVAEVVCFGPLEFGRVEGELADRSAAGEAHAPPPDRTTKPATHRSRGGSRLVAAAPAGAQRADGVAANGKASRSRAIRQPRKLARDSRAKSGKPNGQHGPEAVDTAEGGGSSHAGRPR